MSVILTPRSVEIRHFHLFAGIGGGALGFNRGHARIGTATATMRCIGGVDIDEHAIHAFSRLAGVPGTALDLFDRQQYRDFHGREPDDDWSEAVPDDIRRAAHGERPHIVFLSSPCKGFSGLLSNANSASRRYQALNRLTLRGIRLMLEAFADDPPELVIFENVPLIAQRGRALLDEIGHLLRRAGYAVVETTHNCGHLGGLAQNRTRFLLVARHQQKLPPFLYEPPRQALKTIGEVIGKLPVPGGATLHHPMHRLPALQWRTWLRLALIEAGSDWRSLEKLAVSDGYLRDIGIMPLRFGEYRNNLRVEGWEKSAHTVTGSNHVTGGALSVADPRAAKTYFGGTYGVNRFEDVGAAVTGRSGATTGAFAVADPRPPRDIGRYSPYRVMPWNSVGYTITGRGEPGAGPFTIADPRAAGWGGKGKYRISSFEEPAGVVIAESHTGNGAFAIADPRLACDITDRRHRRFNNCYRIVEWDGISQAVTGGTGPSAGGQAIADPRIRLGRTHNFTQGGQAHYGVKEWVDQAAVVTGSASHDNGPSSIADPRLLPEPGEKCSPLIISLDDTWHRPFTTLELAALQSFPVDVVLDGTSDSQHREWIGNAVPPAAAAAIASEMAETLLLNWAGVSYQLSAKPIWVQPLTIALSMDAGAPV